MRSIAFIGVLTIAGCANVDIQRVTAANEGTLHGVRYWRPAPYVSIAADKEGACVAKIIYLPNMKEEYAITPTGGFGSITFKPTLTDGWNLTSMEATIDSKTSVTDVLGAIKAILIERKIQEPDTPRGIAPGIYRINFKDDGSVNLSSGGAYVGAAPCSSI